MDLSSIYNEVLKEHNMHPSNKHRLVKPRLNLEGVNPTCGDEIELQLEIEDGVIKDGGFVGSGCAISQASTDIMLDTVIGKTVEEARKLADTFMGMIQGTVKDEEELETLEEAQAFQNISFMPARVKCAELGWRTLQEAIIKYQNNQ